MKKTFLLLSGVLLVIGLLLGPGYYFYCRFFSGSALNQHQLFHQDIKSFSVAGVTSTKTSDAKWSTPVQMDLSPELNPIAFNVSYQTQTPPRTSIQKKALYQAELKLNDQLIWEKSFSISKSRRQKKGKKKSIVRIGGLERSSSHLNTFSVDQPGRYEFNLKPVGGELKVAELVLKVRKNVLEPNNAILLPGVGMLVLGIIGVVLFLSRKRPKTA